MSLKKIAKIILLIVLIGGIIALFWLFNHTARINNPSPESLSYQSEEFIRQWFSDEENGKHWPWGPGYQTDAQLLNNHIKKILFEDPYFQKINPKPKLPNIKIEIPVIRYIEYPIFMFLDLLSKNSVFKKIFPPTIYITNQKLTLEEINTAYDKPDYVNHESDLIAEVKVYTKNDGNNYCFDQEGYTFFIDLLVKKVVYISNFKIAGCE